MYRTCLVCHAALGTNEALAAFPVGRRLAFDAERGRLWVVCRRCERWNLSPLEERWEAIEQGERAFRDARQRVGTGNIGLARLADGTELVRIGRPPRLEFAAWRYGDQFGRRRRQRALTLGAAGLTGAALLAGGPLLGAAAGSVFVGFSTVFNIAAVAWAKRNELTVPHPDGGRAVLTLSQLHEVRLVPHADAGWGLVVPFAAHRRDDDDWRRKLRNNTNLTMGSFRLEGAPALAVAARLLARINRAGAPAGRVRDAVALAEAGGVGTDFFTYAAGRTSEWSRAQLWGDNGALRFLPPPARLALEMAANEARERAALEGELATLEAAWADAEQVAAIADELTLPDAVRARFARLRGEES